MRHKLVYRIQFMVYRIIDFHTYEYNGEAWKEELVILQLGDNVLANCKVNIRWYEL